MTQRKKQFGLGTSFKDLCETHELSLSHLEALIDTLSLDELHPVVDELSDSIDGFISKYQSASFDSIDALLQASIATQTPLYQPKPTSSKHLFEGLEDLLSND